MLYVTSAFAHQESRLLKNQPDDEKDNKKNENHLKNVKKVYAIVFADFIIDAKEKLVLHANMKYNDNIFSDLI